MEMQSKYKGKGVVVAGVTKAPASEVEQFRADYDVSYGVFAEAEDVFDAFGVKAVWGSVVYLIDGEGQVVARGIDEVNAALEKAS
ncbi:MAG: hypothetical protein AAGD14_11090 [Planctomycetota bacterium]